LPGHPVLSGWIIGRSRWFVLSAFERFRALPQISSDILQGLTSFVNMVLAPGSCPTAPVFFPGHLIVLRKKSGGFYRSLTGL